VLIALWLFVFVVCIGLLLWELDQPQRAQDHQQQELDHQQQELDHQQQELALQQRELQEQQEAEHQQHLRQHRLMDQLQEHGQHHHLQLVLGTGNIWHQDLVDLRFLDLRLVHLVRFFLVDLVLQHHHLLLHLLYHHLCHCLLCHQHHQLDQQDPFHLFCRLVSVHLDRWDLWDQVCHLDRWGQLDPFHQECLVFHPCLPYLDDHPDLSYPAGLSYQRFQMDLGYQVGIGHNLTEGLVVVGQV